MIIKILVCGLIQFFVSQMVHIIIWRIYSPKAYPIWLPVIFTLTPLGLFIILHSLVISGSVSIELNQPFYLIIGSSFVMHIALSSMYIHLYPGIVFFSLSLEIIKLMAKKKGHGFSMDEIDLSVFSEANTIDMRIRHLRDGGIIAEKNSNYDLTPKGIFIARGICAYRRMLGLPGIGKG